MAAIFYRLIVHGSGVAVGTSTTGVSVGGGAEVSVGGGAKVLVGGGAEVSVGGGADVSVGGGAEVSVGGGADVSVGGGTGVRVLVGLGVRVGPGVFVMVGGGMGELVNVGGTGELVRVGARSRVGCHVGVLYGFVFDGPPCLGRCVIVTEMKVFVAVTVGGRNVTVGEKVRLLAA